MEDTSIIGVSSRLPIGNIGIFDYDDYDNSIAPFPVLSDVMGQNRATFAKSLLHSFIWIKTSQKNYQLIIPLAVDNARLLWIFRHLEPSPCVVNFANGWRKNEWVSRISPKVEKPNSKIHVVTMKRGRPTPANFSEAHWALYRSIASGDEINQKDLNKLSFVHYSRYLNIDVDLGAF